MWLVQIVAVNDVNEAIVPFTEPGNILREQHMKGNPLTHLITARSAHFGQLPVPFDNNNNHHDNNKISSL